MLRNLFGNTPDPREITNDDASDVYDQSGAAFVDVREPDEWASGHIPNARHIPLGDLAQRAGELRRDVRIITVCQRGGRSLDAVDILKAAGFDDVTSMAGGMNEWQDKRRAVE